MFIGYSLQATLEQINRKGLLQGRIEDVRVYSGQEKDLHVASALPASLGEWILFNFASLFFWTRCYSRRGCPSTIRVAAMWHSIFPRL